MSDYDAPKRPLVYPLKNPVVIEAITESDGEECSPSLFSWPEDSDERVLVPFLLSLNEYNVLASTIDVGRDIAYGDDSIKVLWLWLRNMRCNVAICSMIIDCLLNDEDTQEAIAELIAENPIVQQSLQKIIDNGTLIIGTGPIAQNNDLDKLFAICTYITDTMHEAISQFYQEWEVASNTREQGEILFSAIPVFETLPFDEISEYISAVEANLAENFEAQWSTTPITGSRDRIRCALFCIARDNGNEITWEIIENYFWNRVGFTLENIQNVLFEFVEFLTDGSWSGEEVIDISFGNFAAAMRQGQKFGLQKFPSMVTIAQLGANEPDDEWMIVCEDCPPPPPEGCTDFTVEEGLWSVSSDVGSYDTGNGFQAQYFSGFGASALWVEKEVEMDTPDIEEFSFHLNQPETTTAVFLYLNGSFMASYPTGADTQDIIFNEATVGGSWPKGGDGLYQLRIDTTGINDYRLIEACVVYVE